MQHRLFIVSNKCSTTIRVQSFFPKDVTAGLWCSDKHLCRRLATDVTGTSREACKVHGEGFKLPGGVRVIS